MKLIRFLFFVTVVAGLLFAKPQLILAQIISSMDVKVDQIKKISLSVELLPTEAQKEATVSSKSDSVTAQPEKKYIDFPLLGRINVKGMSLPLLTVVLGLLDGFNPCAMWTLLFLISLLLGLKDKARMWLLGVTFIATSALVYFFFMAAWLNFFLFMGYVTWIRTGIGLLAIGAGIIYLKDYQKNKDGACQTDFGGKKQKVFAQLKEITQRENLVWALIGIILLAFAVNMVELVCSAGLPAVFTQTLALSELPAWQYYGYLIAYLLFFMLDDVVIFYLAMKTLSRVGVDSKYARYSHLIGGILMLLIGLLLIFKPELLMFA